MELAPPQLHDGNLPAALAWLATSLHDKHGLTVDVTIDAHATADTRDLRVLVFESVRELLFDVVKHAKVTGALLRVELTPDDQLQITVADDGIGFDPASVCDSMRCECAQLFKRLSTKPAGAIGRPVKRAAGSASPVNAGADRPHLRGHCTSSVSSSPVLHR